MAAIICTTDMSATAPAMFIIVFTTSYPFLSTHGHQRSEKRWQHVHGANRRHISDAQTVSSDCERERAVYPPRNGYAHDEGAAWSSLFAHSGDVTPPEAQQSSSPSRAAQDTYSQNTPPHLTERRLARATFCTLAQHQIKGTARFAVLQGRFHSSPMHPISVMPKRAFQGLANRPTAARAGTSRCTLLHK
jgi:hypothetical protein